MNTTFDILVIVLSSLLGLFLILSIIVSVLAIKIIKSVKRITDRAERTVESVGNAADFLKQAATPVTVGKVLGSLVQMVRKSAKEASSKK